MLDAVDLEERLRTVLPLLTRQIEALKLLQTRRLGPDAAAKVSALCSASAAKPRPSAHAASPPLRYQRGGGAEPSRVSGLAWTGPMRMRTEMTRLSWRRRSRAPTCLKLLSESV